MRQDLFGNMPNDAERSGNFCGLLDANGNPLQIFDPLTNIAGPRQLFPDQGNGAGCQIPSNRIDSAAKKLLGLFPEPNLTGLATANGSTTTDNYQLLTRSPQSIDVGNFRILHTISQKLSVSGVVNFVSARGQTSDSISFALRQYGHVRSEHHVHIHAELDAPPAQ